MLFLLGINGGTKGLQKHRKNTETSQKHVNLHIIAGISQKGKIRMNKKENVSEAELKKLSGEELDDVSGGAETEGVNTEYLLNYLYLYRMKGKDYGVALRSAVEHFPNIPYKTIVECCKKIYHV